MPALDTETCAYISQVVAVLIVAFVAERRIAIEHPWAQIRFFNVLLLVCLSSSFLITFLSAVASPDGIRGGIASGFVIVSVIYSALHICSVAASHVLVPDRDSHHENQ